MAPRPASLAAAAAAAAATAFLAWGTAEGRSIGAEPCRGATGITASSVHVLTDHPRPGSDLTVTAQVRVATDAGIDLAAAQAVVSARAAGVRLYSAAFSLCDAMDCLAAASGSETPATFSAFIPEDAPSNVEMEFEVEITVPSSPRLVGCFRAGFVAGSAVVDEDVNAENAEAGSGEGNLLGSITGREGEKPFLRANAHNAESELASIAKRQNQVKFLFEKWLEEHKHRDDVREWHPVLESDSPEEKQRKQAAFLMRQGVFSMNFAEVLLHNRKFRAGKVTYAKKLNQFGHLTAAEFAQRHLGGYRPMSPRAKKQSEKVDSPKARPRTILDSLIELPSSVFLANRKAPKPASLSADKTPKALAAPEEWDWVPKGAVTPVKDQGGCGACWAFSAVAALEGAFFLKYGELKSFSEQELVSCESDVYGCRGGLMDNAFNWIRDNGGLCSEEEYPYKSGTNGANGFCTVSSCKPDPRSAIKDLVDVDHTEEALIEAVAQQPVSVAIEADQYAFQFYSHGVLTAECGDNLDHGVTLVGYGVLDGTKFWKLKNSWGESWGMDGYILIERGKVVPGGFDECGILADPSYPVL